MLYRILIVLLGLLPGSFASQGQPLPSAHAHNDYEHDRPLIDALELGFGSVEADIHLVNGQLLVAHDLEDVDPERTLESLYLEPLTSWITEHGGVVHKGAPPLILLVDVKSDADSTYRVLRHQLLQYRHILTLFGPDGPVEGPVLAVISGNRARALMEADSLRPAGYDGRLEDLTDPSPAPASFIPLVSNNWNTVSDWRGWGDFAETDRALLHDLVETAHERGTRIRFWATADNPQVWRELHEAGVDLIGTDDLDALRSFFLSRVVEPQEQ